MTHLALENGEIHARIDRGGHLETFSADVEGVRTLWKRMQEEEHGGMQVIFSSDVDFPEESGLSEDFDLREMLVSMQKEEEENDIQEIFDTIDRLVEEGKIQELAEKSKRHVLITCGKNPDEYNL